ncbi:alpha/beta hydrolase, partial [bacterium]
MPWRTVAMPFPVRQRGVERVPRIPYYEMPTPADGATNKRRIRVPGFGGARPLRVDVHRSRAPSGEGDTAAKRPVLVYMHGGAWVIGQKRYQGLPLLQALAARGWVCFSVDYRLSPHATFPEHLVDVKRGLAWVRAHAAEYGGDPDFVLVAGNSAGAHLASLAALTPNDPEYQPGFEHEDTRVDGCISLYGVYDFQDRHARAANGGLAFLLEKIVMKLPRTSSRDAYAKASPVDARVLVLEAGLVLGIVRRQRGQRGQVGARAV